MRETVTVVSLCVSQHLISRTVACSRLGDGLSNLKHGSEEIMLQTVHHNFGSNPQLKLLYIQPKFSLHLHRIISKYHHNLCNKSSITSIQLFIEEGIIHCLGEGFCQHKML